MPNTPNTKELQEIEAAVTGATSEIIKNFDNTYDELLKLGQALQGILKGPSENNLELSRVMTEAQMLGKAEKSSINKKLAEVIGKTLDEAASKNQGLKPVSNQFTNQVANKITSSGPRFGGGGSK